MLNDYRLKLLVAAIGMATASMASAATTRVLRAQNLGAVPANALAGQLGLATEMTLAPHGTAAIVANGHKVVRQQQMYRGVPIYGRSIAVVQDAQGNALRATGELMQGTPVGLASVAPKLGTDRAIAALKAHAHTMLVGGATMNNQKAELFVYPQDDGTARLVYRVSYFVNSSTPTRPTASVDANSGEVIKSWEVLTDASATGPGGNQKAGKYV